MFKSAGKETFKFTYIIVVTKFQSINNCYYIYPRSNNDLCRDQRNQSFLCVISRMLNETRKTTLKSEGWTNEHKHLFIENLINILIVGKFVTKLHEYRTG